MAHCCYNTSSVISYGATASTIAASDINRPKFEATIRLNMTTMPYLLGLALSLTFLPS